MRKLQGGRPRRALQDMHRMWTFIVPSAVSHGADITGRGDTVVCVSLHGGWGWVWIGSWSLREAGKGIRNHSSASQDHGNLQDPKYGKGA